MASVVSFDTVGALPPTAWHAARPGNPLLESGLVLPRKGAVTKLLRRLPMSAEGRAADIAAAPDRRVLRDDIFPHVARRAGNILFVGVQAYTTDYPALLEAGGGTCFTNDYDPKSAAHGVAGRHATGCVTRIADLFSGTRFETIVMTGVFGFGVNRYSHQIAALDACAATLVPGGMLVLGWNDRRVDASVLEEATLRWFDYRPLGHLPPRIWVTGYDHNFAFLRLRS